MLQVCTQKDIYHRWTDLCQCLGCACRFGEDMSQDSARHGGMRDILGDGEKWRATEVQRHVFIMSECSSQMHLAAFIDVN